MKLTLERSSLTNITMKKFTVWSHHRYHAEEN